jgi:hypothetical protein
VDVTGNITAKLSEVWNKFNNFCRLFTMATSTILNCFNAQKLPHTTVDIPTKFHEAGSRHLTRRIGIDGT